MWLEKPECFDVIRFAWSRGGCTRKGTNLKQKFDGCRSALFDWSKKEFRNNRVKMDRAKHRMRDLITETLWKPVQEGRRH